MPRGISKGGFWFLMMVEGRICVYLAPQSLLQLVDVVMFHHSSSMHTVLKWREGGRPVPRQRDSCQRRPGPRQIRCSMGTEHVVDDEPMEQRNRPCHEDQSSEMPASSEPGPRTLQHSAQGGPSVNDLWEEKSVHLKYLHAAPLETDFSHARTTGANQVREATGVASSKETLVIDEEAGRPQNCSAAKRFGQSDCQYCKVGIASSWGAHAPPPKI